MTVIVIASGLAGMLQVGYFMALMVTCAVSRARLWSIDRPVPTDDQPNK
jgi:hypothetical protein